MSQLKLDHHGKYESNGRQEDLKEYLKLLYSNQMNSTTVNLTSTSYVDMKNSNTVVEQLTNLLLYTNISQKDILLNYHQLHKRVAQLEQINSLLCSIICDNGFIPIYDKKLLNYNNDNHETNSTFHSRLKNLSRMNYHSVENLSLYNTTNETTDKHNTISCNNINTTTTTSNNSTTTNTTTTTATTTTTTTTTTINTNYTTTNNNNNNDNNNIKNNDFIQSTMDNYQLSLLNKCTVQHRPSTDRLTVQQPFDYTNMNNQLDDLDLVDDLALFSHTHGQMQIKTLSIASASASVGFNVQKGKSNILKCNTENINPITLGGEALEDVKSFTYLESIIDERGGCDANVKISQFYKEQPLNLIKFTWIQSKSLPNLIINSKITKKNSLWTNSYKLITHSLSLLPITNYSIQHFNKQTNFIKNNLKISPSYQIVTQIIDHKNDPTFNQIKLNIDKFNQLLSKGSIQLHDQYHSHKLLHSMRLETKSLPLLSSIDYWKNTLKTSLSNHIHFIHSYSLCNLYMNNNIQLNSIMEVNSYPLNDHKLLINHISSNHNDHEEDHNLKVNHCIEKKLSNCIQQPKVYITSNQSIEYLSNSKQILCSKALEGMLSEEKYSLRDMTNLSERSVIFHKIRKSSDKEPKAKFEQDLNHMKTSLSKLLPDTVSVVSI
ncbi:unnamed protein product [Schistosoma margrebowiei]|uniref:Uncharacterized protein n=1 Tax=Schistosoma margrebowiei TaxID=48269 RepID=A0A183LKJ7_9TREM|nr:unnamed protein product [Schistosoma margrebowiei]